MTPFWPLGARGRVCTGGETVKGAGVVAWLALAYEVAPRWPVAVRERCGDAGRLTGGLGPGGVRRRRAYQGRLFSTQDGSSCIPNGLMNINPDSFFKVAIFSFPLLPQRQNLDCP